VPPTTLTDSGARQSITSITFTGVGSGKAFAPTVTINGSNFGKTAPNTTSMPACGDAHEWR
jgi:hypothetical protein